MNLRVVLVKPMYEGNVGSIARAMKNFGFRKLVMVEPCSIGDFGLAMASHAKDVLEGALVVKSLDEAVAGADLVVGTTGKKSMTGMHLRAHLRVPMMTPHELTAKMEGKDAELALLLGPENWGLTNEELMICDMVVSIPTSAEYPVLNLSHAAAVLLYELSQVKGEEVELAGRDSLERFYTSTMELLEGISYPQHKREYTILMLRRIFGRAELTKREVNTLMGILKKALWTINCRNQQEKDV